MELRLEIFAEGRRQWVTLQDLSRTGMFLRMDEPLGSRSRVLVALQYEGRRVVTTAHVTHVLRVDEARVLGRSPGVGIEFREPLNATDQLFALVVERVIRAWRTDSEPRKAHVIIANGAPDLLERLARTFRDGGLGVATATTGIQALASCMRDVPDAIVLDRALPIFDGLRVMTELAADPRLAHIPVIVTAADPTEVAAAMDHGATDFVVQPFTPLEVIVRVRRALAARPVRDERASSARVVASGSLATGFSLTALLSLMEHERTTGRLAVAGEQRGWMDIVDGRIVRAGTHAGSADLTSTVMALLDTKTGTFELSVPPLQPSTGSLSITHVLLEHARLRDEDSAGRAGNVAAPSDEAFGEWHDVVGLQRLPRSARLMSLHDLELGDDAADPEHADDPAHRATCAV